MSVPDNGQSSVGSKFAGAEPKFFIIGDKGINTQVPRESIENEQYSWLENIQPIGKDNRKALYDKGASIYAAATGKTIVYDNFYNIGLNTYAAVFLSDGSAYQVNTATNAQIIIATAGTFYPTNPGLGTPLPAACQSAESGVPYLVIVSAIPNGYWVWDGNLLYGAGTISPIVTLTTGGQGYSTTPTVTLTGGNGIGVTLSAAIAGGSVTGVTVTNPGSGFLVGDNPTVVFNGGTSSGSGASATAATTHVTGGTGGSITATIATVGGGYYNVTGLTIATGGSGYSSFAAANFTTPSGLTWGGYDVPPPITLTIVGGIIMGATFTPDPEIFYTTGNLPAVTITDTGYYHVTSVSVSTGGSGYSPSTTVIATGGGGPQSQAVLTPNITAGVVVSISIQGGGGIYSSSTAPTISIIDASSPAAATVTLMPFGISGTYVETYQSRVWVENGLTYSYSAPNNLFSFSGSLGGGTATSNDPFLRRQITAAKQANGFLYLFGDSSVNVVSNVQSSGSPLVTTLNNQNVDPQEGTTWPNSVQAFGRGILFANASGVFALYGGAAEKISDDLDGIFEAATAVFATASSLNVPSAAAMTLNEQKCYMILVPTSGPNDDGALVKRLAIYDGKKWFLGSQSVTLTFIATQEINSVLYAWGTDGTNLFPLFNTKGSISKVWQTKLWSEPFVIIKQALRLYTMGINNTATAYSLSGTVDSILANAAAASAPFTVTSNAATGPSLQYLGQAGISARGNYLGLTVQTTAPDFTLIAQSLLYRDESPLGG